MIDAIRQASNLSDVTISLSWKEMALFSYRSLEHLLHSCDDVSSQVQVILASVKTNSLDSDKSMIRRHKMFVPKSCLCASVGMLEWVSSPSTKAGPAIATIMLDSSRVLVLEL